MLRNFVDVPDDYRLWADEALKVARKLCRAPHRRHSPPCRLSPACSSGHALRRETGLPWIADYRDLWYGDVLREWVPDWRKKIELRMERRLLREADVIVTVSEPKTAYMQRLHPGSRPAGKPSPTATTPALRRTCSARAQFTGETISSCTRPALSEPPRLRLRRLLGASTAPTRRSPRGRGCASSAGRAGDPQALRPDHRRVRHRHLYDFAGDVSYAEAMDARSTATTCC